MMPISVGQASADFLKYIAEPAARSLALGCIAAIALAAFRVKRVTLRLFVWTAVLCAAVAMPLLGTFVPRVRFSVPARARLVAQNAPALTIVMTRSAGVSRGGGKIGATRATASKFPVALGTRREEVALTTLSASSPTGEEKFSVMAQTPAAQSGKAFPWIGVGLAMYLLVTLFFVARLFLGMFFSRRLERASEEIDDREALRLLRMRACMGGLESTPRLAETEKLSVPATLGVLHPVILLPIGWRQWDEAKLDAVLAHEVSHVARRDALTQRLSLVHRSIFWFSPLAWWMDRQLTELAEEASDEAALAGGADQARYAETLLGFFATLEAAPGRIHWEGVSMAKGIRSAKGCRAQRRVERILAWKGALSMRKSLLAVIVALALPLVFLAASMQPSVARAQGNTKDTAKNKLQSGGPVAPALPSVPKTPGVVAPADMGTPPAPAAAPSAGVVAPADLGPTPQTPPLPATAPAPAPGELSYNPGPTPQAPPVPATPVASVAPLAEIASQDAKHKNHSYGYGYGDGYGWSNDGPRYVIMSGDSDNVNMSGSEEDVEHARELRKKISGGRGGHCWATTSDDHGVGVSIGDDLCALWDEGANDSDSLRAKLAPNKISFHLEGKSYGIADAATVTRARALFDPLVRIDGQQSELGQQQRALGEKQRELGRQQREVKVKVPDMDADFQKVEADAKRLSSQGGTQSDLGDLQSELGDLQSKIGDVQSQAGDAQSKIGDQQSDLGGQQSALGDQQSALGDQSQKIATDVARNLRALLAQAIQSGAAKPE